ncbi:hypothetical protein [Paenibacillus agricola]|uniref:Uncharacterized protein n=1 Tax=Paenibacillus agricola TaxID=2716264 RepID=A0ABX0JEJ4_9BACL|nr:hypothetical protein [Paenibacillus agricola]NHN33118.1 hypothetical protein [Paenibacillus agricola]
MEKRIRMDRKQRVTLAYSNVIEIHNSYEEAKARLMDLKGDGPVRIPYRVEVNGFTRLIYTPLIVKS